jgi:signal transduction histidine kinase
VKDLFKFPGFSKALIIQALFVSIGMVGLDIILVGLYKYKAEENIRVNTFDQILIIKAAILQPFWNLDHKSIDQIAESILTQRSRSIAAIRLLEVESGNDAPKLVIDRQSTKWENVSFEDLKDDEDFLFLEQPIFHKNSRIGTIQTIFSISEAKKEISQVSFLLGALLLFFTALCLSILLTYHLRRLSRELQQQVDQRTRELDSQRMAMVNSSRLASLGEMSAGIAHEINNPLAVIDGTIRLIGRQLTTNPDMQKIELYLAKIAKMVTRISKIINGLRAFSRDGSQEPVTQFPVEKFFNDISDLCQANLSHKQVNIQFKIDDPTTILTGREVQLSQVMINMINNSGDAVENLEEKWIKVECLTNKDHVVISVTDSGKGIPVEIQKKMLQPFFTTKELGKGTGLGLSISIGIIEAHGGSLNYCNESNNTRFEILLKRSNVVEMQSAA